MYKTLCCRGFIKKLRTIVASNDRCCLLVWWLNRLIVIVGVLFNHATGSR